MLAVTDGGRQLVLERHDGVRERLGELLTMLSQEQRDALDLAARVALPVINSLIDVETTQPTVYSTVSNTARTPRLSWEA